MEGERTTREAIEAFMQSELADTVVRRGSEMTFAQQVDTWIRTLNFDEWEAYPGYLSEDLSNFLEDEINAGRLREMGGTPERGDGYPTAVEQERFDTVWSAIYNIAIDHLTSRQVEVYRDRPMREAIEGLMQSEYATAVIPREYEQTFRSELDTFIHGLDLDRYEGDPSCFGDHLDAFLNTAEDRGWFADAWFEFGVDRTPMEEFVKSLEEVVTEGIEVRYSLEVAQGDREDMRAPVEAIEEVPVVAAPLSIAERLQGLLQRVKEFVRGHEAEIPARGQDLER